MKLLYNANIHTLDKSHPQASAILIEGGRILAVGGTVTIYYYSGEELDALLEKLI